VLRDEVMMQVPTIEQADALLVEAQELNPGVWVDHSRVAGNCARAIANACPDLDPDSAYVMALLHDIGRRFGVTDMRHVIDGYRFLQGLGFTDAARICLTHSFSYQDIAAYSGKNDCTAQETAFIADYLATCRYDDYDRLAQLCDVLAFPSGPVYIEKRLVDVALRHGINDLTLTKWRIYFERKDYFDKLTSTDIYLLLGAS